MSSMKCHICRLENCNSSSFICLKCYLLVQHVPVRPRPSSEKSFIHHRKSYHWLHICIIYLKNTMFCNDLVQYPIQKYICNDKALINLKYLNCIFYVNINNFVPYHVDNVTEWSHTWLLIKPIVQNTRADDL